jgi:hypothetical protein
VNERESLFPTFLYWSLTLLLFVGSLSIRLFDIQDLPLDFHPTRQLFSALKARGIYYQTKTDVPEWQREMAIRQWKMQATIEPEIVEHLAAFSYRIFGKEDIAIPRVYSILFWEIGGIFLFFTAKRLYDADGALLSLSFYLFLPYGIFASRSFQPDPLMVAWISAFLWAISLWMEKPTWARALLAGLFGGAAIFVKTVAFFLVGGGIIGSALGTRGIRRAWKDTQIWGITLLSILPAGLYFIYGIILKGFLTQQLGGRFFPQLLLSPIFYIRWGLKVNMVLGYLGIVFALLGTLFVSEKAKGLLLGLWGGYLAYGLVFDYHFSTHDYYQLPLIPIAALAMTPFVSMLREKFQSQWGKALLPRVALSTLWILAVAGASWTAYTTLRTEDYRPLAAAYREIGDMLREKGGVVALSEDYGYRLAYWGWLNVSHFPSSGDIHYQKLRGGSKDFSQIFQQHIQNRAFFLVTDFDEWKKQDALREALETHYPVLARSDSYLIFDLSSEK